MIWELVTVWIACSLLALLLLADCLQFDELRKKREEDERWSRFQMEIKRKR